MATPPIILASTSRWRRELLERLHLPFTAIAPDCDETPLPGEAPDALVERLSRAKAASVAAAHPGALVIGSDQVAALGSRILTKPGTHAWAREQLAACSAREVVFHTGLCLHDTRSGGVSVECVDHRVGFRTLTEGEIERYLEREAPYDCAGSIRSEGYAVTLFDKLEGPDPTALVGLPLIRLCALLRQAGISLP